MKTLAVLLATVGGAGRFPWAPGTVGSAVGVVVYLAIVRWPLSVQLAIVAGVSVVGIWASTLAAEHFGREDPGEVVIDEVAGQLVTLVWTAVNLPGIVVGFFLFRVLDIVKPWPARRFEALPGGVGIMADDLMVGVYGNVLLQLGVRLLPEWL